MTLDAILKLIIAIANILQNLHLDGVQQAREQGRAQGMAEMEAKYIVQAQAAAEKAKQDA